MSEEKTKYIYWHPGDKQPDDLSGWKYFNESFREFMDSDVVNRKELKYNFYRKAVTEAEYRAHHGMKAWPCECPDGEEVVDFRKARWHERYLTTDGTVLTHSVLTHSVCGFFPPVPILRKIKPELPEINEDTVLTDEMEFMYNKKWTPIYMSLGYRVDDFASRPCFKYHTIIVRYIDQPKTEYTYTKPIEWVTPTKQDIIGCIKATGEWPKVDVDGKDYTKFGWSLIDVCCGAEKKFYCRYICNDDIVAFEDCRMDASKRKDW